MEGPGGGGAFEATVIWVLIALIWAWMTYLVLRVLQRANGGTAVFLFLVSTVMIAILTAPAWFLAAMILFSIGSGAPEGPMGAGGAAIGVGLIFGMVCGLLVSGFMRARRPRERGLT